MNKQICFACDEDIAAYANWLHKGAEKFGVSIHAWVFMANHVHLLMTANEAHGISNCMQYLGRYYVRYFNYRYKRTGTLFEDRFKSHLIQSNRYFLICSRYIELNPVRAGMVAGPRDYRWSSFAAQALGLRISMWSPHEEYERLGSTQSSRQIAYRRLFQEGLSTELISEIKDSQKTGFLLGTKKFREEYELLTGVRQSRRRRGRRPLGSM